MTAKDEMQLGEDDAKRLEKIVFAMKEQMKSEFKLLGENLLKDFQDAYGDRTSLLQDTSANHEVRIGRMERKLQMVEVF